MARRVRISVVGDAASYIGTLQNVEKSTLAFQRSIDATTKKMVAASSTQDMAAKKVALTQKEVAKVATAASKTQVVDAEANADAQIKAAVETEAALRKQIAIFRARAQAAVLGSKEMTFANAAANRLEKKLTALMGFNAEKQIATLQATAEAQISTSLSKQKALRADIAYYDRAATAAMASAKEQTAAAEAAVVGSKEHNEAITAAEAAEARFATATRLSTLAQRELALSLGVTQKSAQASARSDAAAAKASMSSAEAQLSSSMEKRAALKADIHFFEMTAMAASQAAEAQIAAAAAAVAGSTEQKAALAAATAAQEEFDTANALGIKAQKALAAEMGITAKQAQAAAKLEAEAAKAAGAAEISAAEVAKKAQQVKLEARLKAIEGIELEIEANKRLAATMVAGSLQEKQAIKERMALQKKLDAMVAIGPKQKVIGAPLTANERVEKMITAQYEKRLMLEENIVALQKKAVSPALSPGKQEEAKTLLAAEQARLNALINEGTVATKGNKAAAAGLLKQNQALIISLDKEIAGLKALISEETNDIAVKEAQARAAGQLTIAEERRRVAQGDIIRQQEILSAQTAKSERQFGKAARGALAGSGAFKALGRSLAFASGGFLAFAVASQGLRSSVDAAIQFQAEMEQIHTQAGAGTDEVERMSKAVKGLAPKVGIGPDELAKGLFHIESAGLRAGKAMQVLRAAAKGAQIGHADLEETTNALIAAQQSGIKGAENMSKAMGALNAIVGAGNMRMGDLVKSFSTPLLSTAQKAGLSLDGVGAALATLTLKWGPNSNAATRLQMAINLLTAPTQQASKELAGIGISLTELGDTVRNKGLPDALQLLKDKLDASGKSATEQNILLTRAFGGGKSSGAIKTLIASIDTLRERQKKINAGISGFGEKWAKTQKTAEFATIKWHAALKTLETEIGAELLPTVTKTANHFANWMSKTKNQVAIQNDFKDAFKFTGEALKAVWFFAQPLISTFKTLAEVVGGSRRAVEFLIAGFVAYKLAVKAAGDATVIAETEAAGFFSTVGTGAELATTKVTGLKAALLGTQNLLRNRGLMAGMGLAIAGQAASHLIPGKGGEATGGILTSAGVGTMIGSFFKRGTIPGLLLGAGMGIKQNIPGKTGSILGNVAMGAGVGATAGMIGGPLAPVTAPMGAAAGAALGLAIGLMKLRHSAESAAQALQRMGPENKRNDFALRRDANAVNRFRGLVAEDRVTRDNARAARDEAVAQEKAARGTNQHGVAMDRLRAAEAEFRASVRTLKTDLGSLGSSFAAQNKHLVKQKQLLDEDYKSLIAIGTAAAAAKLKAGGSGTGMQLVTPAQKQVVADYAKNMLALSDSLQKSDPRMAAVARQLAKIALEANGLPTNKQIRIALKYTLELFLKKIKVDVAGGGSILVPGTVNAGRDNRMAQQIAADNAARDRANRPTKDNRPRPIREFKIPYKFEVEAAAALSQKQDVAAAKHLLVWVKKLIAGGRLVGQAVVDALQERRSLMDTIAGAAKKAKEATTRISKLVPSGIREQVAKAGADFAKSGTKAAGERLVASLKREREWITNRLKQGHFTGNQRVALENEMKRISGQIGSATKKFMHDHWTIPIGLQLAQAKADALAALNPQNNGPTKGMVSIAEKVKKAAMKSINSHQLTMQGLIDAWNAVAQANQVLAQRNKGMVGTYHAVSSQAFTAGLGLSGDARRLAEERYAQTISHRGYRPSGPAAQGQLVPMNQGGGGGGGITIHTVNLHGIRNVDQLYSELEKKAKQRGQRRGQR